MSWFIFIFFVIIAYIGNVIAFIMAGGGDRPVPIPWNSINDLTEQSRISVGVVKGGMIYQKLRDSKITVYSRLFKKMEAANSFVANVDEGVRKVRQKRGDFVLLMESLMAEYYIEREPCSVMTHGNSHFSTGIGLATRLGLSIRDQLTNAVLQMREDGAIQALQKHWWQGRGRCGPTASTRKEAAFSATVFNLRRLAVPFIILVVGAILSVLVMVGEIVFKKLRQ